MNGQSSEKEFFATGNGEEAEQGSRTIPVEMPERFPPEEPNIKNGTNSGLMDGEERERFQARWNEIQAKFVDEPRASVSDADALVTEVIQQISKRLTDEVQSLERQWSQGDGVSTEDLRQVLQHYRSVLKNLVV